jgi:hypothetical protein
MTQDDIIRMARVAGVRDDGHRFEFSEYKYLAHFAHLVAAAKAEVALAEAYRCGYEAGAAAEREGVAEMFEASPELISFAKNDQGGCIICGLNPYTEAKAIRARGNT